MTRLLPRTLVGQVILILLSGLLVSHLAASWIYTTDREQAVRAIGGYVATQRIANLARLIDEAPLDWRDRIVAAANDPTLRISLSSQPPTIDAEESTPADLVVRGYLAEQLPDALAAHLQVAVARAAGGHPLAGFRHPMPRMGPWMHGAAGWRGLQAALQLSDGQWLSFVAALPASGPSASWQFVAAMVVMSVIVVLTSIWAVRRVTAPLGTVLRAAERFGRDVKAPPMAEAGSREMRQAAHAFNEMQVRLQRLLENRTRMLAALSHDLRTPLTLLRLRAEGLKEGEERERMLATIGDLDAMVDATLKFARDEATAEPWRRTDLTALVTSIVDDMADAGLNVTIDAAEPVILECQSRSLRRAVTNLLDNAVKYGDAAHVRILGSPADIRIVVDDEGPGIPAAEVGKVFEPFYRIEQSRNRETGGTGLGLAIAQSIAQAHQGEITLVNRPEGGLRAILSLPR
jgi:signal transduction histidine kinase